jgi:putative colanic acid biosynthesis glycosyltransferase WcaI
MTIRDIVILTQYFPPESGAPSVRLMAMALELQKAGVRVRVVTGMPNYPLGTIYPGYRGRLTMREEVNGIPVRRVWMYPASGRGAIKRLLNYLSFTVTGAIALMLEPRADLIFVEAQPVTLAIPAWLLKVVRSVPYVYNTPDLQVEHAADDAWISLYWLTRAAAWMEGKLMRDAAAVTTVTHAFIEHFHRVYGVPLERLTFLPNGADTDRLRPMVADEAYAARLGVAGKKVFTYAGTMANYQGLEVLVEVAESLRSRPDIVILMVGSGPVKERLVKLAAEHGLTNLLFRTSPFQEMPQLMSITTASLVVLRPIEISKKMRLSKAIPPLACGVPVIYAGWGETADIIRQERVGVTVEPGDVGAVAQAIEQLADDPAHARKLGARGRRLAERDYSWAFLVTDWMRQLRLVLAGQDPAVPKSDRRGIDEPVVPHEGRRASAAGLP